jgi:hypothetical protein
VVVEREVAGTLMGLRLHAGGSMASIPTSSPLAKTE